MEEQWLRGERSRRRNKKRKTRPVTELLDRRNLNVSTVKLIARAVVRHRPHTLRHSPLRVVHLGSCYIVSLYSISTPLLHSAHIFHQHAFLCLPTGHRKDLKTQVDRERQRRRDTIRWVVVGLFLLLALLGLYYYMTRYSVARPPAAARPKAKPTPADKAKAKAQTPKKKRDDKTAPGATKPSEPSAGKKEKDAKSGKPKPKEAGKTSKKPASGKSLPDAKKQPSPKKASGSAAKKPKPAPPPQRKESIVDEVDLSKIRLLRRPFPPADADRPHLMEILSADNLLEAKRFNHAIEKFNEVLKRFPQSPRSLLGKGQALEGLAREKRSNKLMDKAMEFYEDASKVVTANADIKSAALVFLAGAAEVRGKPTKEIAALEKLYALREEMPRDAGLLGLAHLRAGEPKKAKPYFEKVLEASPDDSFARGHLGFVLFSEGQYEEALPLLLDGIRNDPTLKANPKFYLYTGEALNRLRRADEVWCYSSTRYGTGAACKCSVVHYNNVVDRLNIGNFEIIILLSFVLNFEPHLSLARRLLSTPRRCLLTCSPLCGSAPSTTRTVFGRRRGGCWRTRAMLTRQRGFRRRWMQSPSEEGSHRAFVRSFNWGFTAWDREWSLEQSW